MTNNRINVYIIDDNVLIRFGLRELLSNEEDIVVVGDGPPLEKDISAIAATKPDILIFDIPLPHEKAIEYFKKLHNLRLPSIVFAKSDEAITKFLIPLLDAGAVGFVSKPDTDEGVETVKEQILYEIHRNVKENKRSVSRIKPLTALVPEKVIAIGSSTGGPEALLAILSKLPADLPAAIAIVQHMPADFTKRFSQRLNEHCELTVKEAAEGDLLKIGTILLAPGDFHMEFVEVNQGRTRHAKVRLTKDPPQWQLRPTVDHMMISLAPIFRKRLTGVILTGMGEDGVIGMRAIKIWGGQTVVQDKKTSVVFGMGQEVIKNNLADEVLPLGKIAGRLVELVT